MSILLPSQRNTLFHQVANAGFDPRDFEWKEQNEIGGTHSSELVYVPSRSLFSFKIERGRTSFQAPWSISFSPADEDTCRSVAASDWAQVTVRAAEWLKLLNREVVPDLWMSISEAASILGDYTDESDNRSLSTDEQLLIKDKLDEMRSFLDQVHDLDQHQRAAIFRRLDYLQEAATRVGKKDWQIMAAGLGLNIVITLGLNPPLARELFAFIGILMRPLLGSG